MSTHGTAPKPIEIFCSYSHKDDDLRAELVDHLASLRRRGIVNAWHDREMTAGTEWEKTIDEHLNTAGVILLLVSVHFINSRYCYDLEMMRALERHKLGEARVIPVLLRPVDDWQSLPFGKLSAVPSDNRPITLWPNRDEAFAHVAQRIREAIEELQFRP